MATGRFASSGVGVVKTMQQLLNEINQVKNDVEASIKTLKRIDTGRKKAAANRDRSVEGRTQIRNLNERINDLQNRMGQMTKESDPTWPAKTFDKSKQDALKTLSSLSNKLNQLDRHLEKATGATHDNTQPVLASTESAEGENTKGIGALVRRLSFDDTKKKTSLSNSDDEESDEEDAVVRGTQGKIKFTFSYSL
jgi:prefoldin subunit 5